MFTSVKLAQGLGIASLSLLSLVVGPTVLPQGSAGQPRQLDNEASEILSHLSIVWLDDGQGGTVKTIRLTGANLQIVNGAGATATVNGLGNLIVGYNELRTVSDRTGSHNIVGGRKSNYSSYGGLVCGELNTISGNYAAVVGSSASEASGYAATVTGGHSNAAAGGNSWVSGGNNNQAWGQFSVISGGRQNDVTGELAVVTAGVGNEATEFASAVLGGFNNTANGRESAILGGRNNVTGARWTSIAGGLNQSVNDVYHTRVGQVTFVE